jgi:hypothetical protein
MRASAGEAMQKADCARDRACAGDHAPPMPLVLDWNRVQRHAEMLRDIHEVRIQHDGDITIVIGTSVEPPASLFLLSWC